MFEKNVLKETILERYLPDYPAMLLVPKEIEDFEKFRSEFRCIAEVLKQSNEGKQAIEKTLKRDGHYKHISREAVAIINEFAGMHIKMREGETEMDMCRAWKENMESGIQIGLERGLEQGLERGVSLINKLIIILTREGRMEDLARAAEDSAYQEQLLKEYNLK